MNPFIRFGGVSRALLSSVAFLFVLAGCGGSSGSSGLAPPPAGGNGNQVPEPALAPPTNLQGAPDAHRIIVAWEPSSGAEGYHLYYATEPGIQPDNWAAYESGTWLEDVTSPMELTELTNGASYFIIVTAFAGSEESEPSNEITLIPKIFAPAGGLNDTGIRFCGADLENNNAPCNGSEPAAQDAFHGRDARQETSLLRKQGAGRAGFDFTKISNSGKPVPPSTPLGDGPDDWACTRDNVSGYYWEVKVDDPQHLRYQGHQYSWYRSNTPDGNPGEPGDTESCAGSLGANNCNTENYVAAVNAEGLCGYTDWFVPSVRTFWGLLDLGGAGFPFDQDYFPNIAAGARAWTSTPFAGGGANANFSWTLNPGYRSANVFARDLRGVVILSRVGHVYQIVPPAYCLNNNTAVNSGVNYTSNQGVVTDIHAGLMWKRCVEGLSGNDCQVGSPVELNWIDALNHAQEHVYQGYDDWRLPNSKELQSLVETCRVDPSINTDVFPNTPSSLVWSGSPTTTGAYTVLFNSGNIHSYDRDREFHVRLVRDVDISEEQAQALFGSISVE